MSTPSPQSLANDIDFYLSAPFGTWPLDVTAQDVDRRQTKVIDASSKSILSLFDDKCVAKGWRKNDDLPRELKVISRAGDCAVSLIGRLFRLGTLHGVVMPNETPLDSSTIASKEERIRIIYQLRDLVHRLHEKGIIHGDIKPANLLRCSNGQLRLCDFECASVEGDGFAASGYTIHYASPWRVRNIVDKPLSKAEDLHATGITMWEIFTGTTPFPEAEDEDDVENFVGAGMKPDVGCIDDPAIASLVSLYLDSGPPLEDTIFHTGEICVETEYNLRFCSNQPPHTYTRVLQCWNCINTGNTDHCPRRFVAARVTNTTDSPFCPICNKGVIYRGLL